MEPPLEFNVTLLDGLSGVEGSNVTRPCGSSTTCSHMSLFSDKTSCPFCSLVHAVSILSSGWSHFGMALEKKNDCSPVHFLKSMNL